MEESPGLCFDCLKTISHEGFPAFRYGPPNANEDGRLCMACKFYQTWQPAIPGCPDLRSIAAKLWTDANAAGQAYTEHSLEILKEAAAVAVLGSAANEWEVDKCMKEEIAFEEDTKSEWLYTAFMEARGAVIDFARKCVA